MDKPTPNTLIQETLQALHQLNEGAISLDPQTGAGALFDPGASAQIALFTTPETPGEVFVITIMLSTSPVHVFPATMETLDAVSAREEALYLAFRNPPIPGYGD